MPVWEIRLSSKNCLWALIETNLRNKTPCDIPRRLGLTLALLLLLEISLHTPWLWKSRVFLPRRWSSEIPAPEGTLGFSRDGFSLGQSWGWKSPWCHLPGIISASQLSNDSSKHLSCRTQLSNNLSLEILLEPWGRNCRGSCWKCPIPGQEKPQTQLLSCCPQLPGYEIF